MAFDTPFYVDNANGSDAFGGSSESHTADLTGIAATRAANVYTLDGSPDLSSIVDGTTTIAIVGETSGQGKVAGNNFLITAHDDGANTVNVSPTPSGGTSGLAWNIGGAFATIQHAFDTATSGDTIYIQGGTTYTEVGISSAIVGSSTLPIKIIGYTTTITDEGHVTVTPATGNGLNFTGAACYLIIKNIKSNSNVVGFDFNTGDYIRLVNCEASLNSSHGVYGDNNIVCVNCQFLTNTGNGIDVDTNGVVVGCIAGASGTNGNFHCVNQGFYYRNLIYGIKQADDGISDTAARVIISCTFDGEGGSNADASNGGTATILFVDNIVHDCNYGLSGLPQNHVSYWGHNLFSSIGTANYVTADYSGGDKDVEGAPNFTDEAGDDYTLGATSDAIDVGVMPGLRS